MPPAERRAGGALRRGRAAVARGVRASGRGVRRATHAGGAGESGLARMLELHLLTSAADALIVTALASTIFFAVPTEEARGRVATSLLVTMVPFLVLAPVIGPFLDRFRRGRRYALAATMVIRAFLAWVMASAITGGTPAFSLYPAAFGFLVCQKAYLVTRAAAVPRVLPEQARLVTVNARMAGAGVIAMAIGGPIGVAVTRFAGPEWTLRLAFVVFAAGTVLALAQSAQVDSDGEGGPVAKDHWENDPAVAVLDGATLDPTRIDLSGSETAGRRRAGIPRGVRRKRVRSIGATAVIGLRGNAALRAFTGFLTLFLAFRLRTNPPSGIASTTAIVIMIVVAAVGGGVGTALGALARRMRPERVVAALLGLVALVSLWAAFWYGMVSIIAVSLVAGLGQALGKLCLDALIQDEVPDAVRTSAFARSETALQLAWVLGGGLGLALPLSGPWGLGVAAVLTGIAAVAAGTSVIRLPNRAQAPRAPRAPRTPRRGATDRG